LTWPLLSLQRKNTPIVGLFGAILGALPPDLAEQVKSLDTADGGIRVTLRTGQTFRFLPNTAVKANVARIVAETRIPSDRH
jgi:hypothetical protein